MMGLEQQPNKVNVAFMFALSFARGVCAAATHTTRGPRFEERQQICCLRNRAGQGPPGLVVVFRRLVRHKIGARRGEGEAVHAAGRNDKLISCVMGSSSVRSAKLMPKMKALCSNHRGERAKSTNALALKHQNNAKPTLLIQNSRNLFKTSSFDQSELANPGKRYPELDARRSRCRTET